MTSRETRGLQGTRLVLVTPARNEATYLPALAEMLRTQRVPPFRWVVVDDGSTDETSELLHRFSTELSFFVRAARPVGTERSFAAKADAVRAAAQVVAGLDWTLIGCLDADVRVPVDYVERIIAAFDDDPRLGVAGARYFEMTTRGCSVERSPDGQVAGCTQVFRRALFEELGGYRSLPDGGEDTIANVEARARGWRTAHIDGLLVEHLRPDADWRSSVRRARRRGRADYDLGTYAWYELARIGRRVAQPPPGLGALAQLGAFLGRAASRRPRAAPAPSCELWRREQRDRAREAFARRAAE